MNTPRVANLIAFIVVVIGLLSVFGLLMAHEAAKNRCEAIGAVLMRTNQGPVCVARPSKPA